MPIIATFISGLLFSTGLIVSGLINPAKVLNFLDIAGSWDPSLAITMAVAVATTAIGYRLAFAQGAPLLGGVFQLPAKADIDGRLASGAAIFGIGWGLVGFCPGPAVASLGIGANAAFIFVLAMLAGMAIARSLDTFSVTPITPQAGIKGGNK
ncbi:DUF6691 family protein [Hyphomicrobium sp. NDB2Meth4]|uniref:DUF6691 family protein n=1 Tax=Hyphomicrobium sp. NDB2Meth4 TaxID=1892846 RepID=UPI0009316EDE|nr:DUF6691 family protein [Hyphomicrobium sp. NDB2Meth4]